MQRQTEKQIERYLKILSIVAVAILIFLCVQLVREYHHLRRLDYLSAHGSLLSSLRVRQPVGASDISSVAAWMTFDYINHSFISASATVFGDEPPHS